MMETQLFWSRLGLMVEKPNASSLWPKVERSPSNPRWTCADVSRSCRTKKPKSATVGSTAGQAAVGYAHFEDMSAIGNSEAKTGEDRRREANKCRLVRFEATGKANICVTDSEAGIGLIEGSVAVHHADLRSRSAPPSFAPPRKMMLLSAAYFAGRPTSPRCALTRRATYTGL